MNFRNMATIIPVLAISQTVAMAGTLRDFEDDASEDSEESDDDSDFCLLCEILEGAFDEDDDYDRDSYRVAPSISYEGNGEPFSLDDVRWGALINLRHGFWGRNLYGNQIEALLSANGFLMGFEGTMDVESYEHQPSDRMATTRFRIGFTTGEELKIFAMGGFSVLAGEKAHAYYSSRLGVEYLNQNVGTRWTFDGDFGEKAGFMDCQAVGIVKKGPFELHAGYRLRVTATSNPVLIHGPQVGVSFRF